MSKCFPVICTFESYWLVELYQPENLFAFKIIGQVDLDEWKPQNVFSILLPQSTDFHIPFWAHFKGKIQHLEQPAINNERCLYVEELQKREEITSKKVFFIKMRHYSLNFLILLTYSFSITQWLLVNIE